MADNVAPQEQQTNKNSKIPLVGRENILQNYCLG